MFDTSSWMIVSTESNPRVFDVYVPGEYESRWTVNLIEHLCQMEDERGRLRKALEAIRDMPNAGDAARSVAAEALGRRYHNWLVNLSVSVGRGRRVYCSICGKTAAEPALHRTRLLSLSFGHRRAQTVEPSEFWADAPDDWDGDLPPWHEYAGPPLTDELVRAAEEALGYKLPAAYLGLLGVQNGGLPRRRCISADRRRVEITGLYGVGGWYGVDNPDRGSRSMIREWGYPETGVVIAPTPSGGHDAIMLDYGECGPAGEPRVVHVEAEGAVPVVTVLSPDFASFVSALVACPG